MLIHEIKRNVGVSGNNMTVTLVSGIKYMTVITRNRNLSVLFHYQPLSI
jgi:hypothetical protein